MYIFGGIQVEKIAGKVMKTTKKDSGIGFNGPSPLMIASEIGSFEK